jgi:hypothetical protein
LAPDFYDVQMKVNKVIQKHQVKKAMAAMKVMKVTITKVVKKVHVKVMKKVPVKVMKKVPVKVMKKVPMKKVMKKVQKNKKKVMKKVPKTVIRQPKVQRAKAERANRVLKEFFQQKKKPNPRICWGCGLSKYRCEQIGRGWAGETYRGNPGEAYCRACFGGSDTDADSWGP